MRLIRSIRKAAVALYWITGAHEEDDYPANLAVTHHDGDSGHDVVVSELDTALSPHAHRARYIQRFRIGGKK